MKPTSAPPARSLPPVSRRRALGALLALGALGAAGGEARADKKELTVEALLSRFAQSPGLYARFREEKRMAVLDAPLVSEGTVHFARPGRLARHTLKPKRSTVLIEQGRLRFGDESGSHEVDLKSNPVLRQFVESLLRLFEGDIEALREVYTLEFKAQGERDGWRLSMKPKSEQLARIIERIELQGEGIALLLMKVVEAGGDEATTTFSDVNPSKKYTDAEIKEVFRLPSKK